MRAPRPSRPFLPLVATAALLVIPAAHADDKPAEKKATGVVGAAAPAQKPAAQPSVRVMVLDLKANGVDDKLAAALTDLLATSLAQTGRFSVAGSDDLRTMLRAVEERQLVGCDSEACFKGVAETLGAQSIVHGSVAKVGETYVLNVSRVDVDKGTTVGRASEKATKPDDLVGQVDRVATVVASGLGGPVEQMGEELLRSHEDCVWAAVQYDKEKRARIKRPRRLYRATFGSEHFEFAEYDGLGEYLPLKPDLAFLGRYPSCLAKTTPHEDAFSIKEERPLVLRIGKDAAYDLVQLRRRRKVVLDVTFEIVGARIYPLKEYDWRSCEDGDVPPFKPSDVAPNAYIRVHSAVLRDLFHGRRYAVTRQQWDPGTESVTLASLPVPERLPGDEDLASDE